MLCYVVCQIQSLWGIKMARHLFSLEDKSIQVFQKMGRYYFKTQESATLDNIKKKKKSKKLEVDGNLVSDFRDTRTLSLSLKICVIVYSFG